MRRTSAFAATMIAVLVAGLPRASQALSHQDRARARGGVVEGQSIDTTFRMDKGALIDLETTIANIVVTGTSGTEVRVRSTGRSGRVRLRASATLATLRVMAEQGDVRYEVSVPPGIRVLMRTTSGQLTATGVKGDVEARNLSGDIRLTDISGVATVETVSGQVIAERLEGGAHIETTSGDVTVTGGSGEIIVESTSGTTTLTNVQARAVQAESMSGNVHFQGAIHPEGRYEFEAHSGNIRLTLPPGAGALLTLSTYSGSIESEFPITLQQTPSGSKEKELQFRLGNGSARLTAESFSGNITITRGTARDRQE